MITRTDTWCCVRREHIIKTEFQTKQRDSHTEKKTAKIKKPGRMSREVAARKKLARLENGCEIPDLEQQQLLQQSGLEDLGPRCHTPNFQS